ncbi:MAG: CHASE2 domain-containing serine/threonine-protein kinase [Steroidobacteraceae bacterium]
MFKALYQRKPIVVHAAIAILLLASCTALIPGADNPLQRWLYDLSQQHTAVDQNDSQVVIIAIDEDSKSKLGDWPWSNSLHAGLIEQLRSAGTKAIAFSVPLQTSSNSSNSDDTAGELQLVQAIKAHGRVVLPLEVSVRSGNSSSDRQLNSLLRRTQRHFGDSSLDAAISVRSLANSSSRLLTAASGIGHVIAPLDSDGTTRREYAAVKLHDLALPALSVALSNLATDQRDALIVTNDQLQLNAQMPPLTVRKDLSFAPLFPATGFTTVSYWQVLTGEFDREQLHGKTALVGFTDGANADRVETPVGTWPRVAVIAAATNSLLQANVYRHPFWASLLEILISVGIVGLCTISVNALNNKHKILIYISISFILLACDYWLLRHWRVSLHLVPQAIALLGYPLASWALGGQVREKSTASPAISMDTLKTLALTLHGQGQLDLAYETLRRCQPNQDTLDLTYRLAADYERRRDILKAAQVYRYISECNPNYKDAGNKFNRLQELIERPKTAPPTGEPKPLRNISKPKPVEPAPVRTTAKETLGRYEIERQIGKGAMGVVYLGRDPKINRVVAIKAIPLAEEFEDQDLAEARERFFREAEMAGRLNHPGIVTIFDAGEDHGLAYIAMEYIQGEHLSYYCETNRLLPVKKALTLIIRVAEALNYAHLQNVVHRDIKPANIMFNIDTDALKITDFGIARLSDVSRTKTGIVLGTPSFMSPEQLEGRPLDGRSDLFALGVTMYQLLTGQLPFRADSMTRLMNNIATEPHPPIRSLRPELPAGLESIIDRCLAKSAEDRFQSGVDMAEALRNCMRTMTP